jgi:hypothetical protein
MDFYGPLWTFMMDFFGLLWIFCTVYSPFNPLYNGIYCKDSKNNMIGSGCRSACPRIITTETE